MCWCFKDLLHIKVGIVPVTVLQTNFFHNMSIANSLSNETTSTVSPVASLNLLSINTLKAQLPCNITLISVGLIGFLGNMLLIYAIFKNKKLRSNFYLCQLHLALADMLMCLASVIVGLKRVIFYATGTPETSSPLNCFGYSFALYVFQNVSPAQAILIAFDRLVCVTVPTRYKDMPTTYLQIINISLWVIPTIIVTYYCATYISDAKLISTCVPPNIWKPITSSDAVPMLGLVLNAIVIVVYVALMAVLVYRIYDGKRKGTRSTYTFWMKTSNSKNTYRINKGNA